MTDESIIPAERVERAIRMVRGYKVLLDADLARMYEVETRELIQAVKRNIERFPADFMFQLTVEEFERLRSQTVISKPTGRGGRRGPPYAFTEQGVAMLSSVLHSPRAVQVNIEIMRAFVRSCLIPSARSATLPTDDAAALSQHAGGVDRPRAPGHRLGATSGSARMGTPRAACFPTV